MDNQRKRGQSIGSNSSKDYKKSKKITKVKRSSNITELKSMIEQYDLKVRLLEKNRKCLEKSHRSASRKRGSSGNLPKVDKLDNPEILGKLALNTMPSPKFNYDAKHYDSEIPPSTDGPSSSEQSFVCSLESKDLSESFETFGKLRINPNESVENDDTRIKPANYNFITEHHKKASTDTCWNSKFLVNNSKLTEILQEDSYTIPYEVSPIKEIQNWSLLSDKENLIENFPISKELENLKQENLRNKKMIEILQHNSKENLETQKNQYEKEITKLKDIIRALQNQVNQHSEDTYEKLEIQFQIEKEKEIEKLVETYENEKLEITQKYQRQVELDLMSQKEQLVSQFKEELDNTRNYLLQDHEKEYNNLREQLMYRIQVNETRVRQKLQKEFENKYKQEFFDKEQEHEKRMKTNSALIKAEFERKMRSLKEENGMLRKDFESLESQIEENRSRDNFKYAVGNSETSSAGQTLDSDKIYTDLFELNQKLKIENTSLHNSLHSNNLLCRKCKAFVKVNGDFSSKLSRLRSYLDS